MRTFNEFCEGKDIDALAKKAGVKIDGLNHKQIKMGMEVEKEHDGEQGKDTDVVPGHDQATILKIAVAHLREKGDYYTRLKKVEGE